VTVVLSNEDVARLVSIDDAIADMETTFRAFGNGEAVNRPRSHTYFPRPSKLHPGFEFRVKSQEGGVAGVPHYAVRVTANMAGFEQLPGGVKKRKMLPAANGRYVGLVLFFDVETTELAAIAQDSLLQVMRVGATSAVGARRLARPGCEVLALFGSGWQAQAHLEALKAVFPLRQVRVYSPTRENRERFAAQMSERFELEVRAAETPAEALRGADLVQAATTAKEPVFDGRDLHAGQHVGCIVGSDKAHPRVELDDTTLSRSDVVVITSRESARLDEQPDIYGAVQRGVLSWERIYELGELLNGRAPGRSNERQITLFNNNIGMGIQFAALGSRLVARAREQGVGHQLPSEWFTEETPP
jgi:alanine dehydrogenase